MTCDSKPTGSKVIFQLALAAILAAILDISNCSRISAWYPFDVRYRGPKDVESSEKKNYISRCTVYLSGDLTSIHLTCISTNSRTCQRKANEMQTAKRDTGPVDTIITGSTVWAPKHKTVVRNPFAFHASMPPSTRTNMNIQMERVIRLSGDNTSFP